MLHLVAEDDLGTKIGFVCLFACLGFCFGVFCLVWDFVCSVVLGYFK